MQMTIIRSGSRGITASFAGDILVCVGSLMSLGVSAGCQTPACNWGSWPIQAFPCPGIFAMAEFDDGNGPHLYAAHPIPGGVGKWNGISWEPLGTGLSGGTASVNDMIVHDDGCGPALYVVGTFTIAGGIAVNGIARWNGVTWSALASGIGGSFGIGVPGGIVLESGNVAASTQLFVGGTFVTASGIPANCVARWDGTAWFALGGGIGAASGFPAVYSMGVFDGGSGPELYVGGTFDVAGGVSVSHIARWSGSQWSDVGGGVLFSGHSFQNPFVRSIVAFDDGSGPAAFVGGDFLAAGGGTVSARRIARWNGVSWGPVGVSATANGFNNDVLSLGVADDGNGPAIFASGTFISAQGLSVPAQGIARWNGTTWSALGSGVVGNAITYLTWQDGGNPVALIGGAFCSAGGLAVQGLARWGCRTAGVALTQLGGPGSPSLVSNTGLMPGRTYYNIFSFEPCTAGPGTGPYLGLCASAFQSLVDQFMLPVGTEPFHFAADAPERVFGPYSVPPMIVEGVCFDYTQNQLGSVSSITRLSIQ